MLRAGTKSGTHFMFYAEDTGYYGRRRVLVVLEDSETIEGISVFSNNHQRKIGWDTSIALDFTALKEQFIGFKVNYTAI